MEKKKIWLLVSGIGVLLLTIGISLWRADMNMYEGIISSNSSMYGGGICFVSDIVNTFVMNGG